jgi:hypothetical protein
VRRANEDSLDTSQDRARLFRPPGAGIGTAAYARGQLHSTLRCRLSYNCWIQQGRTPREFYHLSVDCSTCTQYLYVLEYKYFIPEYSIYPEYLSSTPPTLDAGDRSVLPSIRRR